MKRIYNFAILSLLAISSLTFSSCGKDDSDNDTTVDNKDINNNDNNDDDGKDDVTGEIVVISEDGFASGDNIFRPINKSSFYLNDIEYSIGSDYLKVIGYDKDRMKGSPKIVGNVKYGGKLYKVTIIGEGAFEDCTILTSITLPNTIIDIDHFAFMNCKNLTSVTMSNSVEWMGNSAFFYCSSLKTIKLSSSLTNIGKYSFEGCTALTSITIPNSVTIINHYAFHGSGLTSIDIPNSVTEIGKNAFTNCSGLTSIHCKAKNVPYASSALVDHENCTLYVPKESVDAYKSTYPWNTFKNIIGE